ncbi:hypothetical protein AX16_009266 [Volvariella volvacea WC 439]|nr:hypothetical protein AX16_009266 [Volvariella volvacea WC 439]
MQTGNEHRTQTTSTNAQIWSARHADDIKLAELGYRSEFKREFSMLEAVSFAFSVMSVVSYVSSTLGFGLVSGGHVGIVWGWFIPCFFVATVALSMAELVSSMPTSAGLYYFSAKMAPPGWAPLASWITGWANVTGQITLACSVDFTCAEMIATAITVASDGRVILSAAQTYGILVVILFSHGIVCSAATNVVARLNIFYVIINVGTTIAVIFSLLVVSEDNRVSVWDAFMLFENNTGWDNNAWAFMLAFTAPMWTLTGYDCAAHISEEVTDAAKVAPTAILVGVGATAILGWLLCISTSFVITSVSDLLKSELPLSMGQVLLNVLGKRAMLILWSSIIVAQYVTGAAQGVDASRVVFAFARDNALPGSSVLKRMNPYTRTPVNAVWLVMVASAVCGCLSFSGTALTSLAGASVIGLYTSYAAPIFLRITSGRNKLVPGPFHLGRWSSIIGTIAVSWVAFIVVLLLFPAYRTVHDKNEMNYTVALVMGVFFFASASWMVSARHWFTGPVRTLIVNEPDSAATSTTAWEGTTETGSYSM